MNIDIDKNIVYKGKVVETKGSLRRRDRVRVMVDGN
jgi:hypothetical protein